MLYSAINRLMTVMLCFTSTTSSAKNHDFNDDSERKRHKSPQRQGVIVCVAAQVFSNDVCSSLEYSDPPPLPTAEQILSSSTTRKLRQTDEE